MKREEQLAPVSASAVSEARGEVLPKFMRAALPAPERNAPTDRSPRAYNPNSEELCLALAVFSPLIYAPKVNLSTRALRGLLHY